MTMGSGRSDQAIAAPAPPPPSASAVRQIRRPRLPIRCAIAAAAAPAAAIAIANERPCGSGGGDGEGGGAALAGAAGASSPGRGSHRTTRPFDDAPTAQGRRDEVAIAVAGNVAGSKADDLNTLHDVSPEDAQPAQRTLAL